VVPEPTVIVPPLATLIFFSLANTRFPLVSSDTTRISSPALTIISLGVLKNAFREDVGSGDNAVANPAIPVNLLPSP